MAAFQLTTYNISRKTTGKEKLEKHLKTIEKKYSLRIIAQASHWKSRIKSKGTGLGLAICKQIIENNQTDDHTKFRKWQRNDRHPYTVK